MHPLTFPLLHLLAGGDFHSGEVMARTLGVSRASVWNALHGLDIPGLEVFKVRGRGYRLAQPLRMLDAAGITRELAANAPRFSVEVIDQVESTNSLLLQRSAAGARSGSVIAAEWQTQGRGRRGQAWHAIPGASLTFSLLWRFQQGAGFLAGLSLAAGVAVARVLNALGVQDVGLKWPNDVWCRGGKLAGVLIEMHGDMLGPSAVVLGLGLNFRLPDALRERIDQPAVGLESVCNVAPDHNRVLAMLLTELAQVLDNFAQHGFVPVRDEWQRHHIFQNKAVQLTLPDGSVVSGVALAVATSGALVLETAAGQRQFHSGEVSLRDGERAPVGMNATQRGAL